MEKLSIKLKDYSLNELQLDLLMQEFFGKELASTIQESEIVEYGFGFTESSKGFDPKELKKSAESALSCFKLKLEK